MQTIFNVDGHNSPLTPGTKVEYEMPDMYNRPWAKIWEENFEQGMKQAGSERGLVQLRQIVPTARRGVSTRAASKPPPSFEACPEGRRHDLSELPARRSPTLGAAGVVALCFAVNMVDGMDVTILSYVAPALQQSWAIDADTMGTVSVPGCSAWRSVECWSRHSRTDSAGGR